MIQGRQEMTSAIGSSNLHVSRLVIQSKNGHAVAMLSERAPERTTSREMAWLFSLVPRVPIQQLRQGSRRLFGPDPLCQSPNSAYGLLSWAFRAVVRPEIWACEVLLRSSDA